MDLSWKLAYINRGNSVSWFQKHEDLVTCVNKIWKKIDVADKKAREIVVAD